MDLINTRPETSCFATQQPRGCDSALRLVEDGLKGRPGTDVQRERQRLLLLKARSELAMDVDAASTKDIEKEEERELSFVLGAHNMLRTLREIHGMEGPRQEDVKKAVVQGGGAMASIEEIARRREEGNLKLKKVIISDDNGPNILLQMGLRVLPVCSKPRPPPPSPPTPAAAARRPGAKPPAAPDQPALPNMSPQAAHVGRGGRLSSCEKSADRVEGVPALPSDHRLGHSVSSGACAQSGDVLSVSAAPSVMEYGDRLVASASRSYEGISLEDPPLGPQHFSGCPHDADDAPVACPFQASPDTSGDHAAASVVGRSKDAQTPSSADGPEGCSDGDSQDLHPLILPALGVTRCDTELRTAGTVIDQGKIPARHPSSG
ncbi:unnamed protein product [Vitrella brassicaformis CCMP3155]|uniref:Uncharacterized protein n=1 Tax=Vitrella brassicaformis (strain CCMP3155) TaxID=1169540 RepID=A0A0G4EXE5_VITBC|nr:unnamed protein product [Vitrella brassicaformis CCMP3155]|eukprot:CEM03356.1 unnamed protein product [Vitrella brassicaformis CCMP3155]